jgi:hypothetical protein
MRRIPETRRKARSISIAAGACVTALFVQFSACCGQSTTNIVTAESIASDLGWQGAKHSHLLALLKKVDARPLYVDEALLAIEFPKERWRMVHAARQPNADAERDRRWSIWIVTDSAVKGSQKFKHRPTKPEVERFLRTSDWRFEASGGFRTIKCDVFSNAWKEAFGFEFKLSQ